MSAAETHYRIMRLLEADPSLRPRHIACGLGISLGTVTPGLRAWADQGWVRTAHFTRSEHKSSLRRPPCGVRAKAAVTA